MDCVEYYQHHADHDLPEEESGEAGEGGGGEEARGGYGGEGWGVKAQLCC